MKVKKAKWLVILMVVAMLVSLFPVMAFADQENGNGCGECGPMELTLWAGQNRDVGTVTVENDGEKICVTYALNDDALADGWLLYETHLAIATEYDGIPQTRANRWGTNPIPGQFPYGDDDLDGVPEWNVCIDLDDLGAEIGECLFIAAHAVIKRVDCVTDEFTPELSWQRSSEENVAFAPGRGANWTLADGFDIVLDPDEVVWDGGTDDQNDPRAGVNTAISYATWQYAYNNGGNYNNNADLRRFQATFNIPDGYTITGGKLESVNDGYEDMIPINDNIYIFVNENLQFWGGTIINVVGQTEFEGMAGALALRGGVDGNRAPAETDGWYIPGTFPAIDDDDFIVGENVLDVFAEEFQAWGAMHELGLTLEYKECLWEDETAWGEGSRFNDRGNWGMWFKYKVCEPAPVCVEAQLLLNPAAEDGMTNWLFTSGVVRSITEREQSTGMVYSRSGDYFFDFTGANVASQGIGYAASMSQRVVVSGDVGGCPFTAGGWIQTELWPDSTKTGIVDNDYGWLVVKFFDAGDVELGSFDTGIIGNPVEGSPSTDGKQYAEFYLTGTVPAGAAYAVYKLEGYLIQGSFINVFYDDLYFWVGK